MVFYFFLTNYYKGLFYVQKHIGGDVMRKHFVSLYNVATFIALLAFGTAFLALILEGLTLLVAYVNVGGVSSLIDKGNVTFRLHWFFERAFDTFLITACICIPLNHFFGGRRASAN